MTRQEHCQLSLASASDEAHEKDFLGIATIILPMCVMQIPDPMEPTPDAIVGAETE